MQRIWYTFLAPRRCSNDWHCSIAGAGTCQFDSLGYVPWLNGDPALPVGVAGFEGGCLCNHGVAQQSFCTTCVPGLGPLNVEGWQAAVAYQQQLELSFPGLVNPVFDPSYTTLYCQLPCYETTRPTCICGGRGRAYYNTFLVPLSFYIYPDSFGHALTPTCTSIVVNGTQTLQNNNNSLTSQSFSHVNGTRINIINETPYVRGFLSYIAYTLVSCSAGFPLFNCDYVSSFDSTPLNIQCVTSGTAYLQEIGLLWTALYENLS